MTDKLEKCGGTVDVRDGPYGEPIPWQTCSLPVGHAGDCAHTIEEHELVKPESPETCEDRGYVCCETLTPAEHESRYGYVSASDEADSTYADEAASYPA